MKTSAIKTCAGLCLASAIALQGCSSPPLPQLYPVAERDHEEVLERGRKLASAGGCVSCHSALDRVAFSGGRSFKTPLGEVVSTNITSDEEYGIGAWSSEVFFKAVARGTRPDGSALVAAMPFEHFSAMTPEDIEAIRVFLLTTKPEASQPELGGGQTNFGTAMMTSMWRGMLARWVKLPDKESADPQLYRGAYLGEAVVHCGACHTPRGGLGQRRRSKALAGSDASGEWAPDIRNMPGTALHDWTDSELFKALRTGEAPHGRLEGGMAEVVENMKELPDEDIHALVRWLRAAPED